MNQLCCCCCSLKLCLTLCDPTDCSPRAPVSIRFSRQEHRSRLPFPSPGNLPALGIEPTSSVLQADSLPSEPPGKQINHTSILKKKKKSFFKKSELCESLQEPDLNPCVSPYYLRLYEQGTVAFHPSIILLEGGRTTAALILQRHGVPREMASHTPHFSLRTYLMSWGNSCVCSSTSPFSFHWTLFFSFES